MNKFLDKYKTKIFPDINDWKSDHDDLRLRKDWWNMPNVKWIVFHRLAYKWILFYICLASILLFPFLSWWFYNKGNMIVAGIFLLISLKMLWATYLKLKTWKVLNTLNFYDILFREYN